MNLNNTFTNPDDMKDIILKALVESLDVDKLVTTPENVVNKIYSALRSKQLRDSWVTPPEIATSGSPVDHPSHYNSYPIEVITMMLRIWGTEKTIDWCYMTAYKYRMRAGLKGLIGQDLGKERWYLERARRMEQAKGSDINEIEKFLK